MHSRFRERLRYRFENFMAKGGRAIFISRLVLFVSSFILLVLLKAGVGLLETPVGGKTAIPPLGDERFHWDILMQLMDTGAVAGAEGLLPRVVGIVATLLGVVIFSMLIAFITTQLEKTIYNFRKGRSRVLESGHTLILGWNDRVVEIIRELADDEKAYRALTLQWFLHSPLLDIIRYLGEKDVSIVITTDHGSIRVDSPVKILGDKNTNTNLRYKTGRALKFEKNEVFEIYNPADAFLPRTNVSSNFVFCRSSDFFAYPNNYNYYVNYYRNTFQHGGISMEEMIVPFVVLRPK